LKEMFTLFAFGLIKQKGLIHIIHLQKYWVTLETY